MQNSNHLNALRSYLKKLKEEEQTPNTLRLICRVKALIAYYKGNKIKTVANCFDISEKTLKRWIKRFEAHGCESLEDVRFVVS
jgi:DNA-binding MarR family transcriptional regulator